MGISIAGASARLPAIVWEASMYRLYGSQGSGSVSVEAALAEAGAEYEVVPTTTAEGRHLTEEFRRINPRQQVPALRLPDGSAMSEGAAMMLHLADAFPAAKLAPAPGSSARAQHDRWLIFMAVNIYEGSLREAYAHRYTDDPNGADRIVSNARAYQKRHFEILEATIGSGPYLAGDTLTMSDIYLWMLANWVDQNWLLAHCPKVTALAAAVRARPRIAPIHAAHFG
jgi:glutathione S-transferase